MPAAHKVNLVAGVQPGRIPPLLQRPARAHQLASLAIAFAQQHGAEVPIYYSDSQEALMCGGMEGEETSHNPRVTPQKFRRRTGPLDPLSAGDWLPGR